MRCLGSGELLMRADRVRHGVMRKKKRGGGRFFAAMYSRPHARGKKKQTLPKYTCRYAF